MSISNIYRRPVYIVSCIWEYVKLFGGCCFQCVQFRCRLAGPWVHRRTSHVSRTAHRNTASVSLPRLVSWCLASPFSTNIAISETKSQGWRAIHTQWRKNSNILTSTMAALLFSSHPKRESDRAAHLNDYTSAYNRGRQLSHCQTKLHPSPPTTSGLKTEWGYSGRMGRDGKAWNILVCAAPEQLRHILQQPQVGTRNTEGPDHSQNRTTFPLGIYTSI